MPVLNAEVARIFREAADLLELQGANVFRVRAYRTAARTVEELPESVEKLLGGDGKALTSLPGIGKDLAGKIVEIVRTGSLPLLAELERAAPAGAAELMHVRGVGPRRARALCEKLSIRTTADLQRAAKAGRIHELPGFGTKTEASILRELTSRPTGPPRLLRATAAPYAEAIVRHLRGGAAVEQVDVAGSFRRRRETVGDIDVVVASSRGADVVDRFVTFAEVDEILARGATKASVRLRSGLQVDLRVVARESWGAALYYFTGSKAHNIAVRAIARRAGLKINEYGVFRGTARIAGRTEEEVFAAVGLPWIAPELREDRGEIDAARAGRLPRLVEPSDLRGDLQAHTTDSDGRDTLDAMARAAEALGHEYLAITDHTKAVRVAGGLDRRGFLSQMRRVDALNRRLSKLTVLKGAEVDVLEDGSLDLDDETLSALDVVLVAVHSKFDLPQEVQTRRLLRALEHPSVDVLAHPTARHLGRRRPIDFDANAVFRAAAERGVLLEVNAQPERLDLDDVACREAVGLGARLAVSTDAHAVAELGFLRWGVDQARRGWVEKKDVANALPLDELRTLLHRTRGELSPASPSRRRAPASSPAFR